MATPSSSPTTTGSSRGRRRRPSRRGWATTCPLDWASRSEDAHGSTSPEELLAASHAGCYAMALTLVLADHGHKAERLEVTATTTLEQLEVGYRIASSMLEVTGSVTDIDAGEFEEIAREADAGCPVSNALRDNVEIVVEPRLA